VAERIRKAVMDLRIAHGAARVISAETMPAEIARLNGGKFAGRARRSGAR
jgi:hypothetical protein